MEERKNIFLLIIPESFFAPAQQSENHVSKYLNSDISLTLINVNV